jgi:hypothetical protein
MDDGYESKTVMAPALPGKTSNRGLIITVVVALVALLGLGAVGLFMIDGARQEAASAREDANAALAALEREREESDAAVAAAEAAAEAIASEAAETAAAQEAAEAAQSAADDRERQERASAVDDIEDSIAEMAEEHVVDGVIDGPVLAVDCSPVAGGSLDDLTDVTTSFACFVTTEELDDGRARGIGYNATMNWDSGRYTYNLGDP